MLARWDDDKRFSKIVLDQTSDNVLVTDADTESVTGLKILFANKAICDLTGYSREELLGQTPRIFQGNDTDPKTLERIKRALEAGEPIDEEVVNYKKDGTPYWIEMKISPLQDVDGKVVAFASIQRDITERKKVEGINRDFETARSIAKIGIFDYSVKQDLQYWSDELLKMTGLERDSFPAPSELFISGIDKQDRPKFDRLFNNAIVNGTPYELTVLFHRPDAKDMYMQIVANVVDRNDDRRIVGIARDVTSEFKASELLRIQEERFRIIADTVSDALWDLSFDTYSTWVSPNWAERLGVKLGAPPLNMRGWLDHIDTEDKLRVLSSFAAVRRVDADEWNCSFKLVGEDGEKIDVAIRAAILRDSNERAYRMLGNARNITAERRQQEGYTRSRALEALGQMTGGVAHDFNNQLMIIQGNAEILEMSDLDEDLAECATLIHQAAKSSARLTQRLLSFSSQSQLQGKCVDLAELIPSTVSLLKAGIPEAITIRYDVPASLWRVRADANALEQAIINLAVNARDAMPNGGRIVISCENRVVAKNVVPFSSELEPGDYTLISVTDNGSGIPDDVMPKVLDPFFTTKAIGKGTGLGLSTVYGFARQSGGHLTIYSELGQGTTATLALPRYKEAGEAKSSKSAKEKIPTVNGQRILLVEDEPTVRAHVAKLLGSMGYRVTTANDGKEALSLIAQELEFDLLFTDVIMPGGMNGQQLADRVKQVHPQIKVLFTSGYPASAFDSIGLIEREDLKIVRKPYSVAELRTALAEAFEL